MQDKKRFDAAKKCTLISVDEILQTIEAGNPIESQWISRLKLKSCSIAANVWCFAKVGISRHKSSIYPHSLIEVQMFNKPLQPHFCKARVSGWAVIK